MKKENFDKYLDKMVGRIFKVLPLLEQDQDNAKKYIDGLLIEMRGGISYFEENADYISIVFSLESVSQTTDWNVWRKTIFTCINSINKIKQEIKKEDK